MKINKQQFELIKLFIKTKCYDIVITNGKIIIKKDIDYLYDDNAIHTLNDDRWWMYLDKYNKREFEESLEKEKIKIEDLIDAIEKFLIS